jgi:hypothetical protein
MPSSPPIIIVNQSVYTSTTQPLAYPGGALLVSPTGTVASFGAGNNIQIDMGVQLVIPEGYLVLVTTAAGTPNAIQNNANFQSLMITPVTYTATSTTGVDLKVVLNNISGSASIAIGSTTQIVQLTYLKITPPNIVLTTS